MNKGTEVIRKVDLKKERPVYGTIIETLKDNRVRVAWNKTQQGLVRISNGHANSTEVNVTTLVEVTPEIRTAISAACKQRNEEYQRQQDMQRPYNCEKDGSLLSGQVKEGKCIYCSNAVTVKKGIEVLA